MSRDNDHKVGDFVFWVIVAFVTGVFLYAAISLLSMIQPNSAALFP